MTKNDLLYWVNLLAKPVLTALLGLILLINPDSVSTLIAKGWMDSGAYRRRYGLWHPGAYRAGPGETVLLGSGKPGLRYFPAG